MRYTDFNTKLELDETQRIWIAIMKMDFLALDLLLKDSIDYEDIGKSKFLDRLKGRFSYHKSLGDTEFTLDFDICRGCRSKENVCKFTGNKSQESFALYFELKDNIITDIFHCTWYGEMSFWDSF